MGREHQLTVRVSVAALKSAHTPESLLEHTFMEIHREMAAKLEGIMDGKSGSEGVLVIHLRVGIEDQIS